MNQYVEPSSIETRESLHGTFADVLVAWGDFEDTQRTKQLHVQNLIDHKSARSYQSRDAVRADLLHLHSGFLRVGDNSAAARVRSFVAYLDILKDQTKYSLREYYGRMTGLDLKPFTPEQIAEVKQNLMVCMQTLKPGFSESDFPNVRTIMEAAEPELPKDTFLAAMRARVEADKSTVKRLTGLDAEVPYEIGMGLMPNGHKAEAGWQKGRVRITFSQQRTNYRMVAHEISIRHECWGHGLQSIHIRDAVKAGKLPRSFGVLTTTGSEIMHSEAMAESVSRLFVSTGGNSSLAQAEHWFLMHKRMTGFNARILFHEKGDAAGRIYMAQHAPYNEKWEVDVLATNMLPANKAGVHYPLVYVPVHYALNRFAHAVGPATFGKFLGEVLPTLKDAKGLNDAMERHSGSTRYNLPLAL